jgi:hypothetical protein
MAVTPRGMSVQEAYREFRDGNFRVNRLYQRKLVWTLDEKRKLIDSILEGYPIPLLLLAFHIKDEGTKSFEILDGMQRLNAIFSFVENGFALDNKFFDVAQLARAKALAEASAIPQPPAGSTLLSPDDCARFLEYTLAVTEFPATNPRSVTEVFGRINAFGRQLSDQERRQAGVVSAFATVVREIAAEIRGDVSSDSLDLSQMPEISVDVGGEMPAYAIKADDTFWCKQGVLRRNQLRDSEDEQMIADLAASVLIDGPLAFSGGTLDAIYDLSSDQGSDINARLMTYTATKLKMDIVATIAVMRDVIEAFDPGQNAFRRAVHGGANPAKTAFYAVFMAFFDLCVRKRKSPGDKLKIMQALAGLHGRLDVAAGQIRSDKRQQNINTAKGLIQDFFVDKEPPALHHGVGASIQFENALRRSRIETAAFECKQGLLRLDDKRIREPSLMDRVVETICGIANIGPSSSGAVFIGVADKDSDKKRIEDLDGITAAPVGARYCVGIDREAAIIGIPVEHYVRNIAAHIAMSALSEPLKTAVCASIDPIVYRGHSVVCIWVPSQKAPSDVNDAMYVRSGSETKKVEGLKQMKAVVSLFEAKAS